MLVGVDLGAGSGAKIAIARHLRDTIIETTLPVAGYSTCDGLAQGLQRAVDDLLGEQSSK